MTNLETHLEKYRRFKKDAENEQNHSESRIELYFHALFQLLEAVAAKYGHHIGKHQRVRSIFENHVDVFKENTRKIWEGFQTVEGNLRVRNVYGGGMDTGDLATVKQIFDEIEKTCLEALNA